MVSNFCVANSLSLTLSVLGLTQYFWSSASGDLCPTVCSCFQSEGRPTADCHDQGLTQVPSDIPSRVMTLHMDGNNLGKVRRPKYFKKKNLENLVALSLRNCNISEIGSRTFQDLSIIESIDLSLNVLEEIRAMTFSGLTRLKSIDLSQNFLVQIDGNTFSGAPLLKVINLSHNRIKYILNDAFKGLFQLNKIYLQGNRLFQLEKAPFFRMHDLKLLKLEENPWRCDCYLRDFVEWQLGKYLSSPPECYTPESYRGKKWDKMTLDEFACAPIFYGNRQNTKQMSQLGSNVTFFCPLRNANPPADLTWEFRPENSSEKQLVFPRKDKIIMSKTVDNLKPNAWNYTITILRISLGDEGRYQCIGKNKAGYEHETFDLEVASNLVVDGLTGSVSSSGSIESTTADSSLGDLWLIIVVVVGALLILIVLFLIAIYYRKSRAGAQGTKTFKSVNGYGYQVIEGGFSPAEKVGPDCHYMEDCYLPPPGGISYVLPPPHSDKHVLTRSTEDSQQLPQDDSGYLEAPSDGAHYSPRRGERRSNFPSPYDGVTETNHRSNREDEFMSKRHQHKQHHSILRNGKAPLAQQEREDHAKMPLRETAL